MMQRCADDACALFESANAAGLAAHKLPPIACEELKKAVRCFNITPEAVLALKKSREGQTHYALAEVRCFTYCVFELVKVQAA